MNLGLGSGVPIPSVINVQAGRGANPGHSLSGAVAVLSADVFVIVK